MLKRYQKFTKNGKEWTQWFETIETPTKWQLKNKLLNEYKNK